MSKTTSWMLLGGALLLGAPLAHASDHFSVDTGLNYSSGTYGSRITTDIWSAPITAAYQTDRWTFKLAVPYVSIRGSGNVIPGTGLVNDSNPLGRGLGNLLGGGSATGARASTHSSSASGFGDVVASAGYAIVSSPDRGFGINLTGIVKFGTADVNKGLGTGQNDYGLAVDTHKQVGKWTPFGGLGWTNYGSSPYIKLENGLNANAGLDYRVRSSDNLGVYYDYRQRIAAGGAAQSELTAYWSHRFSDRVQLQSYALGGTTRGSPDWGVGTSLKYVF